MYVCMYGCVFDRRVSHCKEKKQQQHEYNKDKKEKKKKERTTDKIGNTKRTKKYVHQPREKEKKR